MSDERNKTTPRVQFSEEIDDSTNKTLNKLDSINELTELANTTSNILNDDEIVQNNTTNENYNPRAQIYGINEIYNDPRQKRLTEIKNTKLLKPAVNKY